MCSRFLSRFSVLALSVFSVLTPFSYAAPPNRIANVVNANRSALPNNVSPRIKRAVDQGAAPSDRLLRSVTLRFSMTAAQQAALSQLLNDQQDPASPRYHQWLTPEQFAAQFGLSSTDIAQVSTWLASQGLAVTEVARSGTFLRANGTVAQFQQAFGTSIHIFELKGERHIANVSDPTLPAAIASVVTAITGLDDFKSKPRLRRSAITPAFTQTNNGAHDIAPGDFYTIYNVTPLLTSGINGSGVGSGVGGGYGIAVVGEVHIQVSDVTAFRTASGLNANPPTLVLPAGQTDPGYPPAACFSANPPSGCGETGTDGIYVPSADDLAESDLDVEWAGAIAPSASLAFVYSEDVLGISLVEAIDNNTAPIVTVSYGECESEIGAAALSAFNQLFQQASAMGQTVINSSGDSGATACDGDQENYPAVLGLSVSFPASSPYITAVGGTMFNEGNATGGTQYWGTTNGTTSGSAIGHIPEVPWNETSSANGIASGGGGVSSFFSKPSWQTGTNVPNDGFRDIPDISFNAAFIHDPYLYCTNGSCTSGGYGSNPALAGGTSFGAPAFAGALALIEQKLGGRLSNINPRLYGLAALQNGNSTYSIYNDVTSGNNSTPCIAGTLNCASGGVEGYTAAAAYDLASGWGSANISNMANAWTTATATGGSVANKVSSAVTLTSSTAVCALTTGSIAVNVVVTNGTTGAGSVVAPTSSGVVPTGMVQFTVDGVATGSPQTLGANGTLSFNLSVAGVSGLHTIGATYLGDSIYAGSAGQLGSINAGQYGYATPTVDFVSTTQKDFSLTPCAPLTASSVSGGRAGAVTLTLTPYNGFTGTVNLSVGGVAYSYAGNGAPVGYSFSASPVTVSSTTAATTALTLYAYQNVTGTSTQPVSISALHPAFKGIPWYAPLSGGGTLACVLFLAVPRRRRWGALLAVMLSVAAMSAIGCSNSVSSSNGGGTGGNSTIVDAPSGQYLITVTATSGSIVHSTTVSFTIQ